MAGHKSALAVASALGAVLSLTSTAQAQGARSVDLQGPGSVLQGEEAVFYSRSIPTDRLEVEVRGRDGAWRPAVSPLRGLAPGRYDVRATGAFTSSTRRFEVRELPPFVDTRLPAEQRLASIDIYVWDADRSTGGRVLEKIGKFLGPRLLPKIYGVKWTFAGRQATRFNVDYALSELGRRGYVIDCYSAVHGYPIRLADGPWTDIQASKGLKGVRLFYTTACFGANGANDFLAAGVKTYVAARGTNIVNSFHAYLFTRKLAQGQSFTRANDEAFAPIKKLLTSWPIRTLASKLMKKSGQYPADITVERALEDSRPIVFGQGALTLRSDVRPSRSPAGRRGLVGALGNSSP